MAPRTTKSTQQNVPQPVEPERMLRLAEVQRIYPKSRKQIWRDIRAGKFPAPIEIGPNAICWVLSEVLETVKALPRRTYGAASSIDRPRD